MTKVSELIKMLSSYNQDDEITNEQGQPFIHICSTMGGRTVLSTQKPIAICNRTSGYIYPTTTPDYFGYSIDLDEDVYEFETTKLSE